MRDQKSLASAKFTFFILLCISVALTGCGSGSDDSPSGQVAEVPEETVEAYEETYSDTDFTATDWTEASHSNDAEPDFTEVFNDKQVKRLDFVVNEARWQSMLDDMTSVYGEFGQAGGNGLLDTDEDPIFVPAEVFYDNNQWYRVGIRF